VQFKVESSSCIQCTTLLDLKHNIKCQFEDILLMLPGFHFS